jgi:hypothetical protein
VSRENFPTGKGFSAMKEKIEFARFQAKDKDSRLFNIIGYRYFITHKPVDGIAVITGSGLASHV